MYGGGLSKGVLSGNGLSLEGVLSEGVLSKGVLSGGGFVRAPKIIQRNQPKIILCFSEL